MSTRPDAATREHWAYVLGLYDHGCGSRATDVPFPPDTEAARCWRAGWSQAEREAIAWSHHEKLEAELAHGGTHV